MMIRCWNDLAHFHVNNFSLSKCQLGLKRIDLLLQRWNGTNTSIHRVTNPGVCFIHHWTHCITSLVLRQFLQKLKFCLISKIHHFQSSLQGSLFLFSYIGYWVDFALWVSFFSWNIRGTAWFSKELVIKYIARHETLYLEITLLVGTFHVSLLLFVQKVSYLYKKIII